MPPAAARGIAGSSRRGSERHQAPPTLVEPLAWVQIAGVQLAPEGVRALQEAHPQVPAYLGAVDSHLNELGYIVPGLGDAGDRQFGTI